MQRWIFQCLFTAVYSTYSCLQLWIYACSKACNVNQSQFNQSRHYCHRGFPSSLAQRLFGSRTFANLDIKEIRWEKKARVTTGLLYGSVTNKVLYHYPPLSHHVAVPSQQHFLRGDLHDHTCESIKAQTHFFCHLIAGCLTCALCCYLQASTFIPTQACHVLKPPPPADFAPVPSYLASIRRHRSGTGLYWELLLTASLTSSSSTSAVPLALSAGRLSYEILKGGNS